MNWLDGWLRQIGVPYDTTSAGADVSSDQSNFPTLVKMTSADVGFWEMIESTGNDVRFADSNGIDLLKYEIESFDYNGQTAFYWVKKPTVSGNLVNGSNRIFCYVGNPQAAAGHDKENVWDSNFKGVWHLNVDKSEGAFDDSTTNDNDGTNAGTIDTGGQIDRARYFDGTNDSIGYGDKAEFDGFVSGFTLSMWVKRVNSGSVESVVRKYETVEVIWRQYMFSV